MTVAHYSKSIKGINTKLGILAHHDKLQSLQDCETRGITLKAIFLELCPFLTKIVRRMMVSDRRALVPYVVLLFYLNICKYLRQLLKYVDVN